jgi:invasion protein IalB
MSIRSFFLCCLLMIASQPGFGQTKTTPQKSAPAAAQPTAKPPAVPANPESQVTTTAFGDWELRCQRSNESARQNCEVSLTIQQKDQPAPVAKIAIGRPVSNAEIHLLVLLPNNVSFPSSVQLKSDDKDVWSIDIPWQRCIPGACFAETSLKDADLVRWKALDTTGKISFKDAVGNEVGITFSFHGLTQALEALDRQAQQ